MLSLFSAKYETIKKELRNLRVLKENIEMLNENDEREEKIEKLHRTRDCYSR